MTGERERERERERKRKREMLQVLVIADWGCLLQSLQEFQNTKVRER